MTLVTVVAVVAVLAAVAVVALMAVGAGVAGVAALGALGAFAGIGFAAASCCSERPSRLAPWARTDLRGVRAGACRAARGHVLGGCLLVGAGCFGGSLHGFGGFCGFGGLLLAGCVLRGGRLSGDGRGGDLLVRTARTAPCRRAVTVSAGWAASAAAPWMRRPRARQKPPSPFSPSPRKRASRQVRPLRRHLPLQQGRIRPSERARPSYEDGRAALGRRFRGAIGPIDRSVGCGVGGSLGRGLARRGGAFARTARRRLGAAGAASAAGAPCCDASATFCSSLMR